MDVTAKSSGSDRIDCVLIDPANDNLIALQNAFGEIHPAELAHILESLPLQHRQRVWPLIEASLYADVLSYLHDEVRLSIIDAMPQQQLLAAALSGVSIPLLLKRFAIDHALSGAVILTTVTDITGFLSFFRSGQPVSALN